MNKNEILQYVKNHPSGKVKIAFTDIDGILRGKYISTEKFLSVCESTTGFCDVIFGWDAGDIAYDNGRFTGWHTGYPDCPATKCSAKPSPKISFAMADFFIIAVASSKVRGKVPFEKSL